MTDIDDVLDQCLTDLLTGASTLEECLARHPEHSEQLEPLLQAAARFEMGSRVRPAPAFKVYARSRLVSHMRANPRRTVSLIAPFWRMMPGLIAMMLTLFVTGTVYAQGVFPGDPFYSWKLTSENAWRLVSSDSVTTDLRIANRRINEMNVTVNDQVRWARALAGYSEVRTRLEYEIDTKTLDKILPPADSLSHPNVATTTPEPVSEPLTPGKDVAPSSTEEKDKGKDNNQTDKDQKDQNKEDKDKDKGKDKEQGSVSTATPEDVTPSPTSTIAPEDNSPSPTVTAPEETIPLPTATEEPPTIPTIEIPPPID